MYMELKDTVELMLSDDGKERFKAEYYQAKIRHQRISLALMLHEEGTLPFDLSCPIELLRQQKKYMGKYIETLERRAKYLDGVEL